MAGRTPKSDLAQRLAQLEAIRSRLRARITDLLINEGELTVNEIAEQLGAKPSALYRHLDLLVEVGLVEERESVRTGKNFARVFASAVDEISLASAINSEAENEAIATVIESQLRHAGKEVRMAIEREAREGERLVSAGSGVGWLTKAERARVDQLLIEVVSIFTSSQRGRGRTLQAYTFACRPVDHELTKRAK